VVCFRERQQQGNTEQQSQSGVSDSVESPQNAVMNEESVSGNGNEEERVSERHGEVTEESLEQVLEGCSQVLNNVHVS